MAEVAGASGSALRVDGSFGLGFRRRVLDPAAQAAAMAERSTSWVALAGELENHGALSAEVRRRGLDPGAGSDADLLGVLWREMGEDAAALARGFHHAVIWHRDRRALTLLADRCGAVKALYFHRGRDFLVFGSTLKAVAAHPSCRGARISRRSRISSSCAIR